MWHGSVLLKLDLARPYNSMAYHTPAPSSIPILVGCAQSDCGSAIILQDVRMEGIVCRTRLWLPRLDSMAT